MGQRGGHGVSPPETAGLPSGTDLLQPSSHLVFPIKRNPTTCQLRPLPAPVPILCPFLCSLNSPQSLNQTHPICTCFPPRHPPAGGAGGGGGGGGDKGGASAGAANMLRQRHADLRAAFDMLQVRQEGWWRLWWRGGGSRSCCDALHVRAVVGQGTTACWESRSVHKEQFP